jgi:hypothetical protein
MQSYRIAENSFWPEKLFHFLPFPFQRQILDFSTQSFFAEKPGNKKEDRNTSPETTMFLRGKFEKSKSQILSENKQHDTIC